MSKPEVSIKNLLASENSKVVAVVAELESSQYLKDSGLLWTNRLTPSTKGGKCPAA